MLLVWVISKESCAMEQATRKLKTRCPNCMTPIELKDTIELWDPVTCHECTTLLEVVSLHPPQVDFVEDEWNDDDNWRDDA